MTFVRYATKSFLRLTLALLLPAAALVNGQAENATTVDANRNAIELHQSLLDLQNPWTVMCVAAHPDDEDGATLTILRRKHGVHTVTVFSTYGEGGQNAIGPELYEELGVIRARETEEAAKIQGSEPYFLGLRDFGFSKSADEAFRIWGHDEALQRLVLKIRQLRPDVIITNHDTASGHGHHQATGRLVLEAFDAAADPRRFPEQLRGGVSTWRVLRLFVRFQFQGDAGKAAEDEATRTGKIVAVNPNERDPVRGKTYAEQALQALQRHATQGPWPKTLPAGGRPLIRYRLVRWAEEAEPLPPNSQTVLEGFQVPRAISDELLPLAARAIVQSSLAEHRQRILGALVAARKNGFVASIWGARDVRRVQLMEEALDGALVKASALEASLNPSNDVLIPGASTSVSLKISNNGESDARIQNITLRGLRQKSRLRFPQSLAAGETINIELVKFTSPTASITVPAAEHLYDGKLFGEELSAIVNVEISGAGFPVPATTRIEVAPAVEITGISPSPIVHTPALQNLREVVSGISLFIPDYRGPSTKLALRLINHQDKTFDGEIRAASLLRGVAVARHDLTLRGNETRELSVQLQSQFTFKELELRNRPNPNVVTVSLFGSNRDTPVTLRRVQIIWADARVAPQLNVGYVRSFDDTLRDSLAALGVKAKELTLDDVRTGDLSAYTSIIIDNRGYQAHPELVAANARLLDYVRDGGTLIVFYHRTNEWNPDPRVSRPQLAPYPIILGNSRVTDENAPIEFTESEHPLLNFPNKIKQEDFEGWIQERGLYYPQKWDSHYSAPLATSDKGEAPLRGGLLAADYGRGRYIYTSMVWYRQLRAGIPGAYRMLANMISYGRESKF